MDKYNIHNMLEDVSQNASTMLSSGKSSMKEMGEMADMIKDLSEAEKNKWESCYYKSIVEAMEESEYGEDYDYRGRMGYQGGRGRMGRRGYEPEMMQNQMDYDYPHMQMGYDDRNMSRDRMGRGYQTYTSNDSMRGASQSRGSRYGYSHDKYMEERDKYSMNDPQGKEKRMKLMNEYMDDLFDSAKEAVQDMSPEEKNAWKIKVNRILNL